MYNSSRSFRKIVTCENQKRGVEARYFGRVWVQTYKSYSHTAQTSEQTSSFKFKYTRSVVYHLDLCQDKLDVYFCSVCQ